MCVYRLCLVCDNEISIDEANNAYYHLTGCRSAPVAVVNSARQPIHIKVPANFIYPLTTDPPVNFVPAATGPHQPAIPSPQIIPVENVVKPADMSGFITVPASAKDNSQLTAGVYIGPAYSNCFSYLRPCTYTPFVSFNAMILPTCKTIHAEAMPILYSKNRFVLHSQSGYEHFFNRFAGPVLTHLLHLRLEVFYFNHVLDVGGSKSRWSTILRECKHLRSLRVSFADSYLCAPFEYAKAVIRVAANIADVKKGTGVPRMTMQAIVEDVTTSPHAALFGTGNREIRHAMARNTHPKVQVPRGPTVELVGRMSKKQWGLLRGYTRKGWRFRSKSPQKQSELAPGPWAEMEWARSQA